MLGRISRVLLLAPPIGLALLAACARDATDYPKVDPETNIPILPVPSDPGDPPALGSAGGERGVVRAALTTTSSCDEVTGQLRRMLRAEVVADTQRAFESAWRQRQWCDQPPTGYADGGVAMADASAAPMPSPGGEDDPEHSETNNQVAGVDEPDLVKTDGKFIYIVKGDGLQIIKSWPAAETALLAQVSIEGEALKLFVLGDRALVYSALGSASSYPYGGSQCTYGYNCVPTGDGRPTKITVLDITDRSAPTTVREVKLSGSLLAARRIGGTVHTVVTQSGRAALPNGITDWPDDWSYHATCDLSYQQIYQAFSRLLVRNLQRIDRAMLTAPGLPTLEDQLASGAENPDPFANCGAFYRSALGDSDQLTSVVSLRLDDEQPARAATILSRPGVVYAGLDALYLAVPRFRDPYWGWFEGVDGDEATVLHKFQLDGQLAAPAYLASGLVKGRLLNQFALDEHAGHLRVASTTGHVWSGAVNTLSVLAQQEAKLALVGLLDGLAPGEDIRSVRFDGERGYIVTFKKTDPLFVLDLAQPDDPKVLGELKIPGFSTYMHKMDEQHLLTVGYDADDQGSFAWFTGVMLQIFDVTDPTHPQLEFKHVIGTRGSSSEALTNHLAFTYFAPKEALALPMTICEDPYGPGGGAYGTEMTFSGLMVFDVTADSGFAERGRVPFPMDESASCYNWWTQASSQVRRSLIIGDFVYSMSDALLKVNALSDLTEVATLPLQ